MHDICFVRFDTGVPELCPFLKWLNPFKESLCIKLLQLSHLYGLFWFFESLIKLLENPYSDDSIVCIVRKKVDNKRTNPPCVSLLCDITTAILVAKKVVYLKKKIMAHIYSTWPPFFVTNGPLGSPFSEAGQNTAHRSSTPSDYFFNTRHGRNLYVVCRNNYLNNRMTVHKKG